MVSFWLFFLHVDNTAQLLDTVQQDVALLDGLLVLSVLCVGSVGLDNAIHLVNNAVQAASRDELGQIPIVFYIKDRSIVKDRARKSKMKN